MVTRIKKNIIEQFASNFASDVDNNKINSTIINLHRRFMARLFLTIEDNSYDWKQVVRKADNFNYIHILGELIKSGKNKIIIILKLREQINKRFSQFILDHKDGIWELLKHD